MATNLSGLISDAFDIYSESYSKIGQIGVKVVDLLNKPGQPKKINELISCSMLFCVISPSITLNDDGDAIVGIVGDIETMNNLLLKLKRCVKLYDVPVFPTPLTGFFFNIGGGGGANENATYVTVDQEPLLPQSRKISAGSGIGITDGGALGNIVISSFGSLSALEVDTTVDPVLNMGGFIERLFYGSDPIDGQRTWTLSDDSNTKRLQASIEISGVNNLDDTRDQTFDFGDSVTIWTLTGETPAANVWRPYDNRNYELIATTYDGLNWELRIF